MVGTSSLLLTVAVVAVAVAVVVIVIFVRPKHNGDSLGCYVKKTVNQMADQVASATAAAHDKHSRNAHINLLYRQTMFTYLPAE